MRIGLFPGQGLDAAAVASALAEPDPVLDRANDVLGEDIGRRVRQVSTRSRPVLPTSVGQPAIFTAGIIAFRRALEAGERFDYLIGHSLGEYTALVASGSIPLGQGLKLVTARAAAMQRAAASNPGGMAAIMNLSLEDVGEICREAGVAIANDNSPVQVVVSGSEGNLSTAARLARSRGGRSVLLPVDGPYHSAGMASAASELGKVLEETEIRSPRIPVISNVSADRYRAPGEIRKLLALQLTHRVRFRESIARVCRDEGPDFVDLGPGRVVGRMAEATARHGDKASSRA
jgi:[acyl-carrier-protein] S-malonyltransferase